MALYSEIIKLIQLYFTLPITTTSTERSFSASQNLLEVTYDQERLNNVMVLHCHKNETDLLDMSLP